MKPDLTTNSNWNYTAMTLSELQTGARATVTLIGNTVTDRRRLLDLGLVPGTTVEAVMRSPLGDPCAYRIRGAVVALRREQASHIEVKLSDV